MEEPVYRRVLLKISGEALAGEKHMGLDFQVIGEVCDAIKEAVAMGVQVGVVIGGGNFWRGLKDGNGRMERVRADHMGMLATTMNCLAVADVLEQKGVDVRVQTAVEMRAVAEPYIRSRAIRHLEKGRVVIFGCGTGNPFFSTDTAAVLRAAEIGADPLHLVAAVLQAPPEIAAAHDHAHLDAQGHTFFDHVAHLADHMEIQAPGRLARQGLAADLQQNPLINRFCHIDPPMVLVALFYRIFSGLHRG